MHRNLIFVTYALLLALLAAISAAYMNLKLGYYLGGSIMAGVLGSSLAILYKEKVTHLANYIQTMASASGSIAGLVVIQQANYWLTGEFLSIPSFFLFLTFAAMYGSHVGAIFTPVLIDRWQLKYPSGFAVAALIQELVNPENLKKSIRKLSLSFTCSFIFPLLNLSSKSLLLSTLSIATIGAGLIAGLEIAFPALLMSLAGEFLFTGILTDYEIINPGEPFQKAGFIYGLSLIASAALIKLTGLLIQAKISGVKSSSTPLRSFIPLLFSANGLLFILIIAFNLPLQNAMIALIFSFIFIAVNGIATGVSDFNPISSAFLISVIVSQLIFPVSPPISLIIGSVVLIATSVGVDMQQDMATGKILQTERKRQKQFQLAGILAGGAFSLLLSHLFFQGFPELLSGWATDEWQSVMTTKIVTAVGINEINSGFLILVFSGFATSLILLLMRYYVFDKLKKQGLLMNILIPTPFAISFGAFVQWHFTLWFALGGIASYLIERLSTDQHSAERTRAIIGAGFISGEAMYFLTKLI